MRRETPILKEALKRISRQDLEARNFRIARATVLYNAKIELPREQWTELDEDKLYLTPHVEAINNIEYTISQLVYIISSVATSVNLFKKSKMRDSSCFNNQHTQIKLTVSQTNLWMI